MNLYFSEVKKWRCGTFVRVPNCVFTSRSSRWRHEYRPLHTVKTVSSGKLMRSIPNAQATTARNRIAIKNYQNLVYDPFAKAFARTRNRSWPDIEEAISLLGDHRLGRVLDIGCWSGRLAGILSNFDSYTGVDNSRGLLSIAQQTYPEGLFYECDMRSISTLWLTPFDTIFLVASFHHLIEPSWQRDVLDQIRTVCAPSGKIVMLNWNLRSEKHRERYAANWVSASVLNIPFSGHPREYWAFSMEELEGIFTDLPLKIIHHKISATTDNFISVLSVN